MEPRTDALTTGSKDLVLQTPQGERNGTPARPSDAESLVTDSCAGEPSISKQLDGSGRCRTDPSSLVEALRGAYPGRSSARRMRIDLCPYWSNGARLQRRVSREDDEVARPNSCRAEPVCPLNDDEPATFGPGWGT